jgi:hypothetical protein
MRYDHFLFLVFLFDSLQLFRPALAGKSNTFLAIFAVLHDRNKYSLLFM